jgi:hypothetical protein
MLAKIYYLVRCQWLAVMIGESGISSPSATVSSMRRAMVARPWLLLLVLTAATVGVLRVHGEESPSSTGDDELRSRSL